jgi:hypothetical protein
MSFFKKTKQLYHDHYLTVKREKKYFDNIHNLILFSKLAVNLQLQHTIEEYL